MTDFEYDLTSEIARKSLSALSEVIDKVNEGFLTPEQGRMVLGTLQTAFMGVTGDQDFHELLSQADEQFKQMPNFKLTHSAKYEKDGVEVSLAVKGKQLIIQRDSGNTVKEYDLETEAYMAMVKTHNLLTNKGFVR